MDSKAPDGATEGWVGRSGWDWGLAHVEALSRGSFPQRRRGAVRLDRLPVAFVAVAQSPCLRTLAASREHPLKPVKTSREVARPRWMLRSSSVGRYPLGSPFPHAGQPDRSPRPSPGTSISADTGKFDRAPNAHGWLLWEKDRKGSVLGLHEVRIESPSPKLPVAACRCVPGRVRDGRCQSVLPSMKGGRYPG